MAALQSNCLGTVLTVVFTSVAAPVLVHVLTDDLKPENRPGEPKPTTKVHTLAYEPTPSRPRPVVMEERVIAQGVGHTADEAWYDAIAKALSQAASSVVPQQVWAQHGVFICQSVLKEHSGLVVHCDDLGLTNGGIFWRRTVAVFVNRTALVERLRAAGIPLTGDLR